MTINDAMGVQGTGQMVYRVTHEAEGLPVVDCAMVVHCYPSQKFLSTEGRFFKYADWHTTVEKAKEAYYG